MRYALACLATACTMTAVDETPPKPAPVQPPPVARPIAPAEPVDADALTGAAAGLNAFAFDFYAARRDVSGNSVMSPSSIALALTLVHAGARGDTQKEIGDALGFDKDAHRAMATVLQRWNADHDDFELAVANRIFGEQTVAYEQAYVDTVAGYFDAPLEAMDFRGAPEPSRQRINAWVEEQTKDKIKDLLPEGSINAATRVALVNATYFKSKWLSPFEEHATKDGDFHTAAGPRTTKLMRNVSYYPHASYDGVEVLEMQYAGGEFGMVVLLPTARDGLAALEAKLDAAHYDKWIAGLQGGPVDVTFPRFTIEPPEPILLSQTLPALGVKTLFQYPGADLTGIAPAREELVIGEGFHKAFIEVDESGTEAAAATAMVAVAGAAPDPTPPARFVADHPFIYVIRDRKNGAILFLGRVADPS